MLLLFAASCLCCSYKRPGFGAEVQVCNKGSSEEVQSQSQ